jgi:hypothetical protein
MGNENSHQKPKRLSFVREGELETHEIVQRWRWNLGRSNWSAVTGAT